MNSIQFISNQVDRVISTPPSTPRRSLSTTSIYPGDKQQPPSLSHDDLAKILASSSSFKHATAAASVDDEEKKNPLPMDSDGAEVRAAEHLVVRMLLFLPRLVYRIILLPVVLWRLSYRALFQKQVPAMGQEQAGQESIEGILLSNSTVPTAYQSIFGAFWRSLLTDEQDSNMSLKQAPTLTELNESAQKRPLFDVVEEEAPDAGPQTVAQSPRSPYVAPASFRSKLPKPNQASLISTTARRRVKPPIAYALRYPRALAPPRPLLPLTNPPASSSSTSSAAYRPKKTLVLDLDETLIHSMSRAPAGFSGTHHLVEVKLPHSQFATLYSVLKRPHCDEFLETVAQWYNLVVYTASLQAYADPMIDWLERDRKYFGKRLYRDQCTLRPVPSPVVGPATSAAPTASNTATPASSSDSDGGGSASSAATKPAALNFSCYVKNLSLVEPDLANVLIIDNSPLSYLDHEANAIGIEGWINDPSDTCLLNLIPFLSALRFATDVRSILAMKSGEAMFASSSSSSSS